ncbi:MAG TPA: Ppx/GppA phosphatase family protein [Thermoleophilaceae bacterium]|nr:Ppx/GppA phosphatase family protein [Thermoleophilaceae bacterium]
MERLAVIDMGSNSWRLVVYGYDPGTPWWSLTDEIREAVRVGEGMGEENELQPGPMDRAVHTAAVFAAFCKASGVEDVRALATSAIRDARNREELLNQIKERTSLDVRVISGEDEARYGYLAIANSTTLEDGAGIELGGGSLQLTRMVGRRLEESASLPLGSVRMSERFLPEEKASGKQMKALRAHVTEELEGCDWWEGERLAGIGGTIRNLAAAAQKRVDFPDVDVGGFELTREALEDLVEELASKPASKRGDIKGIKPDRADVILGGSLVVAAAMDCGDFDALEVSEAGLREGVFFEHALDGDPPLFDDVRRQSVKNLAHRFNTNPEHVQHVGKLSLEIFDGLAVAGLHDLGDEERELLWAACVLHDIGTAIDYDDHHRHSYYLILHAGLPGYTPRELVLIGLIARYHRKGDPDASDLADLERKGDKQRLEVLCGVIRLAEQLERSRDQSVAAVEIDVNDGRVRLAPKADGRGGDTSVAIWSARRNADLLADAIGKEVEVAG